MCRVTGKHGFVAETGGAIPSSTVTLTAARLRFLLKPKGYIWAAAAEAGALSLTHNSEVCGQSCYIAGYRDFLEVPCDELGICQTLLPPELAFIEEACPGSWVSIVWVFMSRFCGTGLDYTITFRG